jgi:hypothetical protein
MTKPNSTYVVTLKDRFDTPAIVQQIEMSDDISDLAFVGCEEAEIGKDPVKSGAPLTLSLRCSEAFAEEVALTKGIASVTKTATPNVMPALRP